MAAAPKKPLPPMEPTNAGKQPPFVPEPAKTVVGPPATPPTPGKPKPLSACVFETTNGLYAKEYPYAYNGQSQSAAINFKSPRPV